jgi:hypothetical protein
MTSNSFVLRTPSVDQGRLIAIDRITNRRKTLDDWKTGVRKRQMPGIEVRDRRIMLRRSVVKKNATRWPRRPA